jgi:hypothetical protein
LDAKYSTAAKHTITAPTIPIMTHPCGTQQGSDTQLHTQPLG